MPPRPARSSSSTSAARRAAAWPTRSSRTSPSNGSVSSWARSERSTRSCHWVRQRRPCSSGLTRSSPRASPRQGALERRRAPREPRGRRVSGSLPAGHAWVRRADELRDAAGLPALSGIDAAERFDPSIHLRPSNGWPLVFLCSLLDAERIADDHEVVVVVASSTGWYTALAASGVLGFDDAFRLVSEMAAAAESPLPDAAEPAEIVYPLTDEAWQPVPARITGLRDALEHGNGSTALAIDLGGFAVLGGTATGIDALAGRLPAVTVADRSFPLRVAPADAWHTPLRAGAVDDAVDRLGPLTWDRPNVTLIDG